MWLPTHRDAEVADGVEVCVEGVVCLIFRQLHALFCVHLAFLADEIMHKQM